jgi:cellulose synthase/poly-beta-1,6-N-acetylglucosamine synthase-like glycosyltransferase
LRAPLALGGTSNYFDRRRLVSAGGWDSFNVTEDADIGLRLARRGGGTAMIALPTLEEAPVRLRDWFNQRTRWTKGHLQTWLVLMRDPPGAISDLGLAGFLLVLINLGGSLLAALMHAPVAAWVIAGLLTPLPGISGWYAGLLGVGYGAAVAAAIASRDASLKAHDLLGMIIYWPMASLAMLRALWELKSRPHAWAKTPHGVVADRPRRRKASGR